MKKITVLTILIAAVILSFKAADRIHFKVPKKWPKPVYDFSKNPLSSGTIQLGRALFYDPILSIDSTISCASCHSSYTAFTHVDHALSHGIMDRIGKRNSSALMNLAWGKSFMWDGAVNHLDMQALAPISSHTEMGDQLTNVVYKLQHSVIYPKLFYKSFGDSLITGEHTLKAISQFLLTLVSANSKYDSVMQKESIFTLQEKKGYKLFKQQCASCHAEPLFTNQQFEKNGLPIDTTINDWGRFIVTKNVKDSLLFKVPTLRNVQYSYPYMHDGRFKTLQEVLKHYNNQHVQSQSSVSKTSKPISLSSDDKVDLISFLHTLTDKHFLFDTSYSYPSHLFRNR